MSKSEKKITFDWILVAILILSAFLRFYSYSTRWGLAYDQAWFAVIARHALNTFQLPLLGPFASGGPFQTGGEWFWIVMIGTLLNPYSVISSWVFITFLSIFQVYLMYVVAKQFVGKGFAYATALLGAVSVSQILQSTNLTSQMTASLCASLLLLVAILYIRKEKSIFLFISGLSVGLASAIHLQGVLLIIPLMCFIVVTKSFSPKKIFLIAFGMLLPWLPVLIIDVQNNFYNTKNMLMYFTNPQSQASYEQLGRRWLTFTTTYVPNSWGRIVGGNIFIGYLEILLVGATLIYKFYKRIYEKKWIFVLTSTIIATVLLRYIKTPLYENYTTFLHPFIFLLIAWAIWNLFKINKYAAYFVLGIIVICSIATVWKDIGWSSNLTDGQTKQYVSILKNKFPNEKFAIYDYNYKFNYKTLPLVLYLQTEGLIDDNGHRVGIAMATPGSRMNFIPHKEVGDVGGFQIFDLESSVSAVLQKAQWAFVNPSMIYNSVEYWYKDK